jgi:glycosyltransferase involved in cell wall biosynthesis
MVIDAIDSKNGAAISTKRLARRLEAKGHTIFFLGTSEHPKPAYIHFPKFYVPFAAGIMRKMKVPLARPLRKKLEEAIKNVDLIHVQFPFWLSINAIKIAKELNKPVISTFHVQAEHLMNNINIRSTRIINLVYSFMLKTIYNPSDIVICPSLFAQRELTKKGLTRPSVVISNGIPEMFVPIKTKRKKDWKERFIIMTVGRLAIEKNQKLIIKAVSQSAYKEKIQLLIFGEGQLKDQIIKYGKNLSNPLFLSVVPAEELVQYYNMADLYVHAAEIEVECMSAMEAMACGKPLLISDSEKSATKQFALDSRSLFTAGNAEDLTSRIDYWIRNTKEREEAGEAYLQLSNKYRIDQTVNQLEQIYLQELNPRHRK